MHEFITTEQSKWWPVNWSDGQDGSAQKGKVSVIEHGGE